MEKTKKIWNRRFILLFLTNLLVLAAFYASIPIIPIYCQEIGITGVPGGHRPDRHVRGHHSLPSGGRVSAG